MYENMYEKQNWEDGDIITAQKLNHVEDGVVNAKAKTIYAKTVENEVKLSYESATYDPVTFSALFNDMFNGQTFIIANGLKGAEIVLSYTTPYSTEAKKSIRTLTSEYDVDANDEFYLVEE